MAKIKVTVTQQDGGSSKDTEIISSDSEFNLKEDWFAYLNGEKAGPHGNSVGGAMVGPNNYFRFPDVIDIKVEPVDAEDGDVSGEYSETI